MHSKKDSLLKRLHSATISPTTCARKWQGQYWETQGEDRVISCAGCRSFDAAKTRCTINFGTPLRKCVVSSIEAHFHNCKGEEVLEIGFGRFKLARNLIVRSGGRWTGVDPQQNPSRQITLGSGGYGHASELPFPDATFDRVFGVQSMEHWGQRAGGVRTPSAYSDCLQEIARVLKPGGSVYFDAPVHFHGHEMFIMGDTERLRSLFDPAVWSNVAIERWREDAQPLERYTPSPTEFKDWPVEIVTYPAEQVARAKAEGVVWLLVITAQKVAAQVSP